MKHSKHIVYIHISDFSLHSDEINEKKIIFGHGWNYSKIFNNSLENLLQQQKIGNFCQILGIVSKEMFFDGIEKKRNDFLAKMEKIEKYP